MARSCLRNLRQRRSCIRCKAMKSSAYRLSNVQEDEYPALFVIVSEFVLSRLGRAGHEQTDSQRTLAKNPYDHWKDSKVFGERRPEKSEPSEAC